MYLLSSGGRLRARLCGVLCGFLFWRAERTLHTAYFLLCRLRYLVSCLWHHFHSHLGGAALTPEALRPMALVVILRVCSWLLLATGMFQIVVSKLGDFRFVRDVCRTVACTSLLIRNPALEEHQRYLHRLMVRFFKNVSTILGVQYSHLDNSSY